MSTSYPDSVRIVLFDEANPESFLVVGEADEPDELKLPGGKFEGKESPQEAAERELLEELGLTAEQVALRAVDTLPNQNDSLSVRHIFMGRVARAKVVNTPDIARSEWVSKTTVPDGKNREHILAALALTQSQA